MLEKEPQDQEVEADRKLSECLFLPENTEIGPRCWYRSSMAIADWPPGGHLTQSSQWLIQWLCLPTDTEKGGIKQHLSAVEFDSWLLGVGEMWKAEKLGWLCTLRWGFPAPPTPDSQERLGLEQHLPNPPVSRLLSSAPGLLPVRLGHVMFPDSQRPDSLIHKHVLLLVTAPSVWEPEWASVP